MVKVLLYIALFSSVYAWALSPCEAILTGLKSPMSSDFERFANLDARYYGGKIKFFIPEDGIGYLMRIGAGDTVEDDTYLKKAVLKFPEYFKQFDIYFDKKYLIIPDSLRLTKLVKNGIRFVDISPFNEIQDYIESDFRAQALKKQIPLGTRGYYFFHDRLDDHMLGSIIMPGWLFEKFVNYVEFENEIYKSDGPLKKYLRDRPNRSQAGYLWDSLTSVLGCFVPNLDVKEIDTYDIVNLAKYLLTYSERLNPNGPNPVMNELKESEKNFADINADYKNFQQKYGLNTITEAYAIKEAVRIIHEITGLPLAKVAAKAPVELK